MAALSARYQVRYERGLFARHRYLAGEDSRRLHELCSAFEDPAVRAVFCARGGYGTMRLLSRLRPLATPKPLVGFSDITALHQWLQRSGHVSIHGPVIAQLGRQGDAVHERLFRMLEAETPVEPLVALQTCVPGRIEGPLLGGNLSVFTRLLGTPFMPALDGCILLLEDVSERPYRLDRMWTHLQLAGVFEKVKGIVLGSFTDCDERDAAYDGAEVLRELAVRSGLPCAAGFPIGHGEINQPVALGARVRLDAGARTLTFLEPAVG